MVLVTLGDQKRNNSLKSIPPGSRLLDFLSYSHASHASYFPKITEAENWGGEANKAPKQEDTPPPHLMKELV